MVVNSPTDHTVLVDPNRKQSRHIPADATMRQPYEVTGMEGWVQKLFVWHCRSHKML